MSTEILVVRHGEIDNPKGILYGRNIPMLLSDQGKEQIRALSENLERYGISSIQRIYSSPLERALESAKIIAKTFGLDPEEIVIDDDLVDSSIPAIAGKPLAERERIHAIGTDEYSDQFVVAGNESRESIVKRMQKAFRRIVSENSGRTALFVSHGDPIQFLLFSIKNQGFDSGWKVYEDKNPIAFSDPVNEENHHRINGYANGWLMDAKDGKYIIYFESQKYFYLGIVITMISILSMTFLYVKKNRKI